MCRTDKGDHVSYGQERSRLVQTREITYRTDKRDHESYRQERSRIVQSRQITYRTDKEANKGTISASGPLH